MRFSSAGKAESPRSVHASQPHVTNKVLERLKLRLRRLWKLPDQRRRHRQLPGGLLHFPELRFRNFFPQSQQVPGSARRRRSGPPPCTTSTASSGPRRRPAISSCTAGHCSRPVGGTTPRRSSSSRTPPSIPSVGPAGGHLVRSRAVRGRTDRAAPLTTLVGDVPGTSLRRARTNMSLSAPGAQYAGSPLWRDHCSAENTPATISGYVCPVPLWAARNAPCSEAH